MTYKLRTMGGGSFDSFSHGVGGMSANPIKYYYWSGAQLISTFGNRGYNRLHQNGKVGRDFRDIGYNFDSWKLEMSGVGLANIYLSRGFYSTREAGFHYNTKTMVLPHRDFEPLAIIGANGSGDPEALKLRVMQAVPTRLSDFGLMGAGTTAISRCAPANPVVDLATSVSEFVGARKLFSMPGTNKTASGEYLNYQLGIAPVVSDIQGIAEAAREKETILKQLERDSGRLIRRRYKFPPVTDVGPVVKTAAFNTFPGFVGPGLANGYQIRPGASTVQTTTHQEIYFSGAFTYYLPKSGWRKDLAQMQRLYGVKPGSETAWNVLPYSFLVDYFANIGDVAHNLDRFARDGLVMPYGYVMCKEIRTDHHTWKGQITDSAGVWRDEFLSGTITRTRLRRRVASPFGFGLNTQDLSPRQLSIMAALGLNRK